jgi:hypothetical protein
MRWGKKVQQKWKEKFVQCHESARFFPAAD